MNTRKPVSAKIMVGAEGLGVPDQDLVEKRAREIAEIQEREIPTASDWEEARRELHGREVANEVPMVVHAAGENGEVGEIVEMLESGGGAQRFGVHLGSQDESNLGEELIREGMEEAEHERMLLAHQPAPEGVEL